MTTPRPLQASPADAYPPPRHRTTAIFLVSVAGLFLEMLLIRWIGTEVRIFAYLQNTVLVVCFLGLGMGCFTCRRPIRIRNVLIPLVVLTLLLAIPQTREGLRRISELLGQVGDLIMWHQASVASPWLAGISAAVGLALTFILMVLIWEMFIPLGRLLGRLMDDHPRIIWAYSVNVAGSLIGIWLFVVFSALFMPPWTWVLAVGVMLVPFVWLARQRLGNLALIGAAVALAAFAGWEPGADEVAWSPYQKLVLSEREPDEPQTWPGDYLITVNNTGYQAIIDLRPQTVQADERIAPEHYGMSQYDLPTKFHPDPNRVLIVGTGSGNDVAGVLRGGARDVTAVEIDPAIIDMGERYHPERPYQSPAVRVVADDARSFFATTDERYDLIIFGLLDSHTMTAMTNARLDHYVYTRESIARAKSLLNDGGVMVLSFEAEKSYVSDRMAGVIREVFGREPLVFRVPASHVGWGGVMFIAGDEAVIESQLAAQPRLAERIAAWQLAHPIELPYTTRIASDDWPYIYLPSPRIPTLYYLLGGLMLALVLFCNWRLKAPGLLTRWRVSHWHFFFLGAAFLLLEVQNISKAAVVLGNTWEVNAVIISGILTMILLANLIAVLWPGLTRTTVGVCLIVSCLGLYLLDISQFAFLPYAAKAVIVGLLTTLPMLFGGVLFIRSFAIVERKDTALGANLLGALVGGLLQSVTFVTGIKALLLIVTGLYLAALLTLPRAADTATSDDELSNADELNSGSSEVFVGGVSG